MSDKTGQLEARVRLLEERMRMLRLSRRILMNLLAMREREREVRVGDLERQNRRLQNRNSRYARVLFASHLLQGDPPREKENSPHP